MKILFITLSNIGDVILTLPALDYLRNSFPQAEITVVVGPRPKEIFQDNPAIKKVIVYDKQASPGEKFGLFIQLLKERFDLVADLRNSFLGAVLPARYKISPFLSLPKSIKHMQARHLYKVQSIKIKTQSDILPGSSKGGFYISPQDREYIEGILKEKGIREWARLIVISPGSRSHIKRWGSERFARLANQFLEDKTARVILVGDQADREAADYINEDCGARCLDLTGKTTIPQLAALLERSSLLITNDSAVLHLGSYLDLAVLALFGPTDELKYGPWSQRSGVVKRQIICRPCRMAQCRFGTLECLSVIRAGDVFRRAQNIMLGSPGILLSSCKDNFRRILIVRTDRIGDVLLSTPAIKALRDNYPHAYIAMMVSPYAKEIVEDNPYLDEVIVYDKELRDKNWFSPILFALKLKKKRFDLALLLHPTNRVHLLTFFAGIPRRVGFDRKLGFLLTDRIKHDKQRGQKHELEYSLDPLRYIGIEPQDRNLCMPLKPDSEVWVKELFRQEGIKETDRLLVIHPAASCPSKIWPSLRFAEVADALAQKYGLKVLLVAGAKDIKIAEDLVSQLKSPSLNLAGKTSVSQLASLLKRAGLFISNDSGPVHIASALGVPVIAIFGRNQQGLSPARWGPLGPKSRTLHKEVGCVQCLAHNCEREFACLKAISVDDVLKAADEILTNN